MMHVLTSAARKAWSLAIALLVLFALGIGLFRVTLPRVADFRAELEAAAADYIGIPLRIGGLGARLSGFTPELVLEDVELLDPGNRQPELRLRQLRLGIAVLDSLRDGSLIFEDLAAVGARFRVHRSAGGALFLGGVEVHSGAARIPIEALIPREGGLEILDSEIVWQDDRLGGETLHLQDLNISLRGRGGRHSLSITCRLAVAEDSSLQVVADLSGLHGGDPGGWRADWYVRGGSIPLAQVVRGIFTSSPRLTAGTLDGEAWGHWHQGEVRMIRGALAVDGLELEPLPDRAGSGRFLLQRIASRFRLRKMAEGWQLDLAGLEIARDGRVWPPGDASLFWTTDRAAGNQVRLGFEYARIADIAAAVSLMPQADLEWKQWLERLLPDGELHDLRLRFQGNGANTEWAARGRLSGFRNASAGGVPAAQGVDLDFWLDEEGGGADIRSQNVEADFPGLFRDRLQLQNLAGRVEWRKAADSLLVVEADEVVASNEHIQTRTRFRLELPGAGDSPFLDLQTDFRDGEALSAGRYYPTGIMSSALVDWLDRAIVSGTVTSGSAVLRGNLDEFPFFENEGYFEVVFGVEDLVLDYYQGWPRLEGLVAETRFVNNSMTIQAYDGMLLESRVAGVTVSVEQLKQHTPLQVRGTVEGSFGDGLRILAETPLASRFADLAELLKVGGHSRVDLALSIPLRAGQELAVAGQVSWDGADIALPGPGVRLSEIRGGLDFTQDGISAEDIQAEILGVPVALQVGPGEPEGTAAPHTRVAVRGLFPSELLTERYPGAGFDLLRGASVWEIAVWVPNLEAGVRPPYRVEVTSDLQGAALNLPSPLGKSAPETRKLRLYATLADADRVRLDLSYAENLTGILVFAQGANSELSLQGGQLRLAAGEAELWQGGGVQLIVDLESCSLGPWVQLVRDRWTGQQDATLLASQMRDMQLRCGRAGLLDFELEDFMLHLHRAQDAWIGSLASRQLEGNLFVADDRSKRPFEIDLNYLNLESDFADLPAITGALGEPADRAKPGIDPLSVPGFRLAIDRVTLNGVPLGRLTMQARSEDDRLVMDPFALHGPRLDVESRGAWGRRDEAQETRLEFTVSSPDAGALARDLGLSANLEQGAAEVNAKIFWSGSPLPIGFDSLSGEIGLHMSRGRFVEIDPGIGRLFGLMSLSALQRRLRLDFTDTFEKGLAFDLLEANFVLDKGDAYTSDSFLEGPAARIDIAGRTGVAAKDYDQVVTVTPHVSTGVPVAAAFAGGIPAGAAALVAQQLLGQQLDKISRTQYSVTGSWEEPEISRIPRPDRASPGGDVDQEFLQ